MLLTRLTRSRDEGSALAAVLGLVLVVTLLGASALTLALQADAVATSSRAGVQAAADARAGIDAVRAGIDAGSCTANGPVTAVGTSGTYQVTVSTWTGSAWTVGCPADGSAKVRLLATGTAATKGLQGATGGDTATLAAVLGPGTDPTGITGPAVYSYSMTSGGLSGSGRISSYLGSVPDVVVKTGDVTCSGAAANTVTDLVAASGSVTMNGSCTIGGNVFASGALNLSGGVGIGGNAVAASTTVSGSSSITGSSWSTAGGLTLSGGGTRVGGNATAASASVTGGAAIVGSAWITGATTLSSATIGGDLTTKTLSSSSSTVAGTTHVTSPAAVGASPYPVPVTPTAPGWIDFAYDPADWPGYTVTTLSGATCSYAQLNAAITGFGASPGVIDARGCTNGVDAGSYQTLTLRNDVAIIAKAFSFGGSAGFAAATNVKLSLITPDTVADGVPTCPAGSSFSISGGFAFTPTVATMIYTPCAVDIGSGNSVWGQVWAGRFSTSGAGTFYYVPVGLPGWNMSTGSLLAPANSGRPLLAVDTVNGP